MPTEFFPLTHPQKRIWYTEKLHPGTGMFSNAGTIKLSGHIDFEKLEAAVQFFLSDTSSIRIRITAKNGEPYQYQTPYEKRPLDFFDFSKTGTNGLYEWDTAQTCMPMPYLDCDLFYFAIVRLSDTHAGVYLKIHHLISDAWSIISLSNSITETYGELLSGRTPLPRKSASYLDYISAEKEYLASPRFEYDRNYWNEKFATIPDALGIKPHNMYNEGTRAQRRAFVIPARLSDMAREYCAKNSLSTFSLFMSCFAVYFYRITGKTDMVIGTPVYNRSGTTEKNTFGMFVSTVPIRLSLSKEQSFSSFLLGISDEIFSALKHQKYPFDLLMSELHRKNEGLDHLFDTTFSFQNAILHKNTSLFNYETRWHFTNHQTNQLNVHVNDREGNGNLIIDYDFLSPMFAVKEIEYIHDHIKNIMYDALQHPGTPINRLSLLSAEESGRILTRFNDTKTPYPSEKTVIELFEQRVREAPLSAALIADGVAHSAEELNGRANALALKLTGLGVGPDRIVMISVSRSDSLYVAILAVLKAGGAFLPADMSVPPERARYMAEECRTAAIITDPSKKDCFSGLDNVITTDVIGDLKPVGENVKGCASPSSLAYVIYTSGSTGRPKGVMIENRSLVNFICSLSSMMDFSPGNVVLSAASISFDLFIMESLPTLVCGGTLVLAGDDDVSIPDRLASLVTSFGVNKLMFTPSRMQLLLSNPAAALCLSSMREIMQGGDALTPALLSEIKAHTRAKIFNFYGPTEITIAATGADLTAAKNVSIGKPLANTQAYILDCDLNPLPIGIPGELFIGGTGLSRGYIDPAQNAGRFVESPFVPGEMLYRTGDLARWFPLGEIEYLGRIDSQVKLRGFRIELSEIEDRLCGVDGVERAVVTLNEDSRGKYLAAYLEGPEVPDAKNLRGLLSLDLPGYMIPSYFVTLDALPMTLSGKIDRSALPDARSFAAQEHGFLPAETETEKRLESLLCQLLGIPSAGRDDSFFEIGGDSLSIVVLSAQISRDFRAEVSVQDIYKAPTLRGIAALIDAADKKDYFPVEPAGKRKRYPLSSSQKRMYILAGIENAPTAYNMPAAYRIAGPLDIKRLESALSGLIALNPSLRTAFSMSGGQPYQTVYSRVKFEITRLSCQKKQVLTTLRSLVKPFDLRRPPLFRAALITTGPDEHVLFMDMHHIASDGMSAGIMLSQISRLYMGLSVKPYNLTYADFAVWQQKFLLSDAVRRQRGYWLSLLSGELPSLNLRTDMPRAAEQRFEGRRISLNLDAALVRSVRALARQYETTPYTVLLSSFYLLLSRYSSQSDIIVGIPVTGRPKAETNHITGMFVNTLPLRMKLDPNSAFSEFLAYARTRLAEALDNQHYPFELLVGDLKLPRTPSRNPIFDVMFSHNTFDTSFMLPGLEVSQVTAGSQTSKLDITFELLDLPGGMTLTAEYCTSLFKAPTIRRMLTHFLNILSEAAARPSKKLSEIRMLSAEEYASVVYGFNGSLRPLPDGVSVESLITSACSRFPDKKAVVFGDVSLSFAELLRKTACLAAKLRNMGVVPDSIVGICLKRSEKLLVAILSVLRAGGAYLPIDPDYPENRVSFMLSDSKAAVVITDGSIVPPAGVSVLDINGPVDESPAPPPAASPDHLFNFLYTSGSTGRPKGVMITRRNFVNCFYSLTEIELFQPEDIAVSLTTFSFDIFELEALTPLLCGNTVCICDEQQQRVPSLLSAYIRKTGASFTQFTPTTMRLMLSDPDFCRAFSAMKTVAVGGEQFPEQLLRRIKRCFKGRIINFYGPTETTVYSACADLADKTSVTIGKPMLNARIYILDAHQNPLPAGVPGELYIGGDGVTRGYFGNEALTSERYLESPFVSGDRIYRTGDLAYFKPDGSLICLGRIDDQIKIGGHRIELAEIENRIVEYPGVKKAVLLCATERPALCAYFVSDSPVDIASLRNHLALNLPSYMVPNYFLSLDALPTTPNGKTDKRALAAIPLVSSPSGKKQPLKMSADEKRFAHIWQLVLKCGRVGPDDDFFALGGDSLAVISVQIKALKYDILVPTQHFYRYKTVRGILKHCGTAIQNQKKAPRSLSVFPPATPRIKTPAFPLGSVLVTGATGFLGAHLVGELVCRGNCRVTCLVRGENAETAASRLFSVLEHYFDESAPEMMESIRVVPADLSQKSFGLSKTDFVALASDIQTVIHAAARTDHFGFERDMLRDNLTATENVIAFCAESGAFMCHISTYSVAGGEGLFCENDFYKNQDFSRSPYLKTKFLAENAVYTHTASGLRARVIRAGNLMPRRSDGRFQINPERNAFMNRLFALSAVGMVPRSLAENFPEFTPVDLCAKAVVRLLDIPCAMSVFHVFSPHQTNGKAVLSALSAGGQIPSIVPDDVFIRQVNELIQNEPAGGVLSGLAADLTENSNLKFSLPECKMTVETLKSAGFRWPVPDNDYYSRAIRGTFSVKGRGF